jgi:hypothetical protein
MVMHAPLSVPADAPSLPQRNTGQKRVLLIAACLCITGVTATLLLWRHTQAGAPVFNGKKGFAAKPLDSAANREKVGASDGDFLPKAVNFAARPASSTVGDFQADNTEAMLSAPAAILVANSVELPSAIRLAAREPDTYGIAVKSGGKLATVFAALVNATGREAVPGEFDIKGVSGIGRILTGHLEDVVLKVFSAQPSSSPILSPPNVWQGTADVALRRIIAKNLLKVGYRDGVLVLWVRDRDVLAATFKAGIGQLAGWSTGELQIEIRPDRIEFEEVGR